MNRQVKLLLQVGAEGGILAVCRSSNPTEPRQYRFGMVDSTLQILGREEGGAPIRRDSGWLDSWDAAMKALNVYPWPRLHPVFVAPEVSLRVWGALTTSSAEASEESGEIDLPKWQSVIRASLRILPHHPLASLIVEGLADPTFAASWLDEADTTFRPYATAILALRHAGQMSADARHALLQELCQRKRVTVLSEVLGKRIPERVLRWSGQTAWEDFALADWHRFFSTALTEHRHSAIAGVRTINRTLLDQFRLIPKPLRRKGLLNIVSQLAVPPHRWESLAVNFSTVDPGMRPGLLRRAAAMEHRAEFWDLYFRCEGKYWQPFRLPAGLPQSELLEPILSPLDMDTEALVMKNCLSARSSRVLSCDRVYFRMRDRTPVNAELIRNRSGWVPGRILGAENAPVPEDVAARVRNELARMGSAITDGATYSPEAEGYLDMLRQKARVIFGNGDIDAVTHHLAAIQRNSLSSSSAYVILEMPGRGYVQFMARPDTQQYLCEISSYKFMMTAGEYLDAAAVDLIEKAGFVWPTTKANFVRWFEASSSADIEGMAAFVLATLHSLFHCRSVDELDVKSKIPPDRNDEPANVSEENVRKPKFALFSKNVTGAEILKRLGVPARQ